MKNYIFLISGCIFGIWISLLGIVSYDILECFFEIIEKSKKYILSFNVELTVSLKFLLGGESKVKPQN